VHGPQDQEAEQGGQQGVWFHLFGVLDTTKW